jgi:hypothetical protein
MDVRTSSRFSRSFSLMAVPSKPLTFLFGKAHGGRGLLCLAQQFRLRIGALFESGSAARVGFTSEEQGTEALGTPPRIGSSPEVPGWSRV